MNKPNWRLAPKTATTAAALALAAAGASIANADTWYWVGQNNTPAYGSGSSNLSSWGCDANIAENWTNLVTNSQGVPQAGDVIKYHVSYRKSQNGIGIRNISNVNRRFGGVVFENGQTPVKQTTLFLEDGAAIVFESKAADSTWTCHIDCLGTNVIDIASGKTLTLDSRRVTGSAATLVKNGAGAIIANTHNSTDAPCDVGTLLLRAGTFGCHYARIPEVRFDSDDPGAMLLLGTRSPHANDATYHRVGFFIENGLLAESDGVANTQHGVTSGYGQNLVFTGTPKVREMVFTGTFYGSAGLVWNPDAANYTFTFRKATHQTTGLVAVSNGTVRVRDGASFPNLSQVVVDGSNSRIRIETSGEIFPAASATLSHGGKLALASGVHLSVAAVTIDGVAVGEGLYHGVGAESQMGSVEASWIDGPGYVAVGPVSAAASVSVTWTGAGADTLSSTPENWSGPVPSLTDGSAFVTVAGGARFTAANGAWLDGFDLSSVASFALGASPGKELWIGPGGIQGASGTYSVDAPVVAMVKQSWAFGDGATVNFNAPIRDFDADGLEIESQNSVFNVNESLGPEGFQVDVEHRNTVNVAAGVTNNADLRLYNGISGDVWGNGTWTKSLIVFKGGAQTVMNGFVQNTNTMMHLAFEDGADVVFGGGVLSRNSTYFKTIGRNARIRFDKPFLARNSLAAQTVDATAVIELNAEGNCLGYANPMGVSGGYPAPSRGTIRCLVPYALKDYALPSGTFEYGGTPVTSGMEAGRFEICGTTTLDLCGNDQSLQCLYAHGGTITSESDAVVMLNDRSAGNWTAASTANRTRVDQATWTGGAGFVYNGASADWPRFMMAVSSTTGRLEIVQGRLVFPAASGDALATSFGTETATETPRPAVDASWQNCSEVILRGGTLEIGHSRAFGKETAVKFERGADGSCGKIKLAPGVTQRVKSLAVDGEALPPGTYGAAGSGASVVRTDLFDSAGSGVLSVAGSATILSIR